MNAPATSVFNPATFMQTTTDEATSTEVILIREGDYTAVSGPINEDSFKEIPIVNGPRAGEKSYQMNVKWQLDDPEGKLQEELGRPPVAMQNIWLDIGKDGSMEMGKGRNVELGLLREALGQNASGRNWSPVMVGGQYAKVHVK